MRRLDKDKCHSQDLVVPQCLLGRASVPSAVWNLSIGCDDIERVVDQVVLEDAIIGCAGRERRRGINLKHAERQRKLIHYCIILYYIL